MLKHLPPSDEREHPDPRQEFVDGPLEILEWRLPGFTAREPVEEGAPSWWQGDEDAIANLLRAKGISSVEELPK